MASFFKQLSDDMDRVAQVVEEGYKFMSGETSQMGSAQQQQHEGIDATTTTTTGGEEAIFDDLDGIEDAYGGSPLMGMADSVMSDIMSTQVGPQSFKEHIQAFTAAISWNEPFIKCILAFHVLVIIVAVTLSRRGGIYSRMGLMIFVGIVIRLAERLNDLGATRWREFATQNYFDKSGIFMGIMVCAPLLMVCLFMLMSMIREASNLLVDVKSIKMKAQQQAKQNKQKKEDKKQKKRDGKNLGKKRREKRD